MLGELKRLFCRAIPAPASAGNPLLHPISLNPGYEAIGGMCFQIHIQRVISIKFFMDEFSQIISAFLQRHILRRQLLVRFRQLQELLSSPALSSD